MTWKNFRMGLSIEKISWSKSQVQERVWPEQLQHRMEVTLDEV